MCANTIGVRVYSRLAAQLERVRCEYCTGRGGATRRDLTELISTF